MIRNNIFNKYEFSNFESYDLVEHDLTYTHNADHAEKTLKGKEFSFSKKANSYFITISFKELKEINGISLDLSLSDWDDISYLALGIDDKDEYRHVKLKNPTLDKIFNFKFSFDDLIYKINNLKIGSKKNINVDSFRLFIKGKPRGSSRVLLKNASIWSRTNKKSSFFEFIYDANDTTTKAIKYLYDYLDREEGIIDKANLYLEKGVFPVPKGKSIFWDIERKKPDSIDENNSLRMNWLSLSPVLMLMKKNYADGSLMPVFAARDFINNWMNDHYFNDTDDPRYNWYDHGVAERQLSLLLVWYFGKKNNFDSRFMSRIQYVILMQAELLSSETFYASNQNTRYHNHAWFQDIALIATAYLFNKCKFSKEWISIASSRLEDQYEKLICREKGFSVFVENSIGYHKGAILLFKLASNLLSLGANGEHKHIQVVSEMQDFVHLLSYPNMKCPSQGDTFREANRLSHKQYKKYSHPAITVLPESGYCILKANENDTPFMFCFFSTSLTKTHKHEDNLSFTLFYDSVEWFIDPSFYSHEYDDFITSYLRSSRAHNSIHIRNNAYSIEPGVSKINDYFDAKEDFMVSAEHHSFINYRVSRKVCGSKKNLYLSFEENIKKLSSDCNEDFAYLMFQCGEGVVAEKYEGSIILTHPNSTKFLKIASQNFSAISIHFGLIKGDLIRGYCGQGFLKKKEISSIEVKIMLDKPIIWELTTGDVNELH